MEISSEMIPHEISESAKAATYELLHKSPQQTEQNMPACMVVLTDFKYDKTVCHLTEVKKIQTSSKPELSTKQEFVDPPSSTQSDAEIKKIYNCIYQCFTCTSKFLTQEALDEHIPSHSDVERKKIHTCYVCMCKFATQGALDKHKHTHSESENEDDLFEEDYVPKTKNKSTEDGDSGTEEKVKNLDVLVRNPDGKPRRGRKRKRKEELKEEKSSEKEEIPIKSVEKALSKEKENVKTPFKCDTCNVFFETSNDAKSHISPNKCKFSCHLCNRKFNTLYAFIVHVMQHKNNTGKNQTVSKSLYACNLCDKHFSDCFQLKRHEITIHKKKPNVEPVATQATEVTMTQVIMRHEENDFTCELCYDIFNTKEELDSHMEFHKQIEDTDPLNPGIMETAVEIVENTKDKQDIITIQSKPVKLSLNKTIPSKKSLTATIKDMISPNEPKKSKIIFLPNIEEEKLKEKKKIKVKTNIVYKSTNRPKSATISKKSDAAASLNETQPSHIKIKPTNLLKKPTMSKTNITTTISLNNIVSSSYVSSNIPVNSTITPEVSSSISTPSTSAIGNTAFAFIILPTASNTHVDSSIETKTTTPESENISLPKIQNVICLNDSMLKNMLTESKIASAKVINEEAIVIDDSDSESDEKIGNVEETVDKDKDNVDSDEESNLVIDEKNMEEPKTQENDNEFISIKEETSHVEENNTETTTDNTESTELICKFCNFSCMRVMILKKHYLLSHKAFLCWKCHFLTLALGEFIEHRNVHTLRDC